MKRQRNRGRGGSGGGKPQHNANRAFDSNGPDNVKVRGAAQTIFERYQQLARDAGSAGDRVLAENYLQHAEHYFRVLRAMQPQRPVSEIMGRDNFASGYDIDFEDEGQAAEESSEAETDGQADGRRDDRQQQGEYRQRDDRQDRQSRDDYRQRDERQQGEYRQRDERQERQPRDDYRQRDDRQRDDRPRDERPRDERPREDRPREDRQRDERPRDDRYQGERQSRPRDDRQSRYQNDRSQNDRSQNDRSQNDRSQGRSERDYRGDRPERDPLGVIEPQATPLTAATATTAPEPAYEAPEPQSVLRGEDGAMSHAPAFLQPASRSEPRAEGPEEVEPRRPRRRRAPRTFEPGQAAEPAEVEEG
ncbi:MAG TPA: DUF4167 domain-containing protein [Caulobacteraceae bacterium]|nr:DUF4167 domain-containing protein [Caulobacteraceae bacterium]